MNIFIKGVLVNVNVNVNVMETSCLLIRREKRERIEIFFSRDVFLMCL